MRKPLPSGFSTGVVWTEDEWQQLAMAWARHERAQPDCTPADRWRLLVPEVFVPERRRPLPKANLEDRAKRLFALLPAARAQLKVPPAPPVLKVEPPSAVSRPTLQIVPSSAPSHTSAPLAEPDQGSSLDAPEEEATKRRRIFWTYEERQAFVRAYALLERQHPHMPASTRVVQAQNLAISSGGLSEARRRTANPTVLLNSPELKPLLEQARVEVVAQANAPVSATTAQQDALPPPQVAVTAEVSLARQQPLAASEAPSDTRRFEGAPADLLAQALGALLREALASAQVQQALSDSLAPLMRKAVLDVLNGPSLEEQAREPTPQAPEPAAPAPVSSPPRKKLLVVGLLGSQQNDILAGFAERFDLRFLTQDDSSTRLEQHARSCDITIGMVGFLSHAVERHLKRAAADYRRCNGTLGELRRTLQGIYDSTRVQSAEA